MSVLVSGFGLFFLPFIIHIFLWRTGIVGKKIRNVIRIFISFWIGALGVPIVLSQGLEIQFLLLPRGPVGLVHSALLGGSLFAAYLLTYPALEADSPSCAILRLVEGSGPSGLPIEELEKRISDQLNDGVVVIKRLHDFVQGGIVVRNSGRYTITRKGKLFLKFFILPRRIFTTMQPGG